MNNQAGSCESHKGDQVTDALVIACVCSIHLLIGDISYHIIEFVLGGGGGGCAKSFLRLTQLQVMLG